MANDLKVMYKILRILQLWRGREDFDTKLISADAMKMEYESWEQLMISMQEAGYIKGLVISQDLEHMFPHICEPIRPRITIDGITYLAENNSMVRAAKAIRDSGEYVLGFIVK